MKSQQISYSFIQNLAILSKKSAGFLNIFLCVSLLCGRLSADAQNFSQNDAKVQALLAQMTLDEKIGQMVQVDSGGIVDKGDVAKYYLGSVFSGGNSDPAAGNSPQAWLDEVNGFKAEALQTR
ncbi:MAG: hypothetical protein ABSF34_12315, partial [Verrucomicrobiota bacterium]